MVRIVPNEKKTNPKRLFLVSGDDPARIEAEAEALFTRLAGESPDEFAIEVIREDDRGPTPMLIRQAIHAIQTPPFLGGVKTVWLKHFTGFAAESRGKNGDSLGIRKLAELLSSPLPPECVFLLDGPGVNEKLALAKACAAQGEILWCNRPNRTKRGWREEMAGCLQRVANAKGLTLSFEVRDALIDLLGGDTSLVEGELEKLRCYTMSEQRPICVADVVTICSAQSVEESWELGDKLGKRDLQGALSLVEQLLNQDKAADQVARSLTISAGRYFAQLLQAKLLMAERKARQTMDLKGWLENLSSDAKKGLVSEGIEIASWNPWRVKFLADNAVNYAPQEMIAAISTFRDAMHSMTTAGVPPVVALENALVKVLPKRRH